MTDFPDHPFWDFSLAVYGSAGVSEACLALQEAHRLDVNLLLFCCWLGASGRGRIEAADAASLVAASGPWQDEVVRSLRAIRRRMKEGIDGVPRDFSEPLRKRVAALEIACEHAEQLVLARTIERAPDETRPAALRAADAAASIARYLTHIGAAPRPADRAPLAALLAAAFPDAGPDAAATLARSIAEPRRD